MQMKDIPFGTTDLSTIPATEHAGERGMAWWKTCQFGAIRVRMVEYSPGYLADHWCSRGHILFVLEGALLTEIQGGAVHTLTAGMSYQVSDDVAPHRSSTETGARLFIVD